MVMYIKNDSKKFNNGILLEQTMRWALRSKIHKAIVTKANVNYIGSITN